MNQVVLADFSPFQALAGGALLGCASVFLMWSLGRIAGISGIAVGIFGNDKDGRAWRIAFLVGLIAAPALYGMVSAEPVTIAISESTPALLIGGFLVGLGAVVGGGCTSGHGVCGMGRLSTRSMISVAVFMTAAFVVHSILQLGFGFSS